MGRRWMRALDGDVKRGCWMETLGGNTGWKDAGLGHWIEMEMLDGDIGWEHWME